LKNALIIGLGDVLNGDEGIGCYILEALAREPVKASVRLLYVGDDPRWAGGSIYAADMVIIVGAFHLGGPAGRMHTWSYEVFRQHMAWMADEYQLIRFLVQALSRADLAGGLPKDLSSLWIEPYRTEGVDMSNRMRKAVWKAIHRIKQRLSSSGLLPQKALTISPILRIEPLVAAG
jgi:hydrogenase maturation protease